MARITPPLVYDTELGGHRGRGVQLFASVVDGEPYIAPVSAAVRRLLRHRGVLLWQTADYPILAFALVAMVRAVLLRQTIGLCYRNDFGTMRTLRSTVRRWIVHFLSVLPRVHMVFIFRPPGSARWARHWIYDPEWWDLIEMPVLISQVQTPRNNDGTVLFIGNVDWLKGVEFFIDTAHSAKQRGSRLQYLIVGRDDRLAPGLASRFAAAGGKVISAQPPDPEFLGYINSARYLWCCYHPAYDQSSGIFGRSLQLGIRAIVREGSLLAAYGQRFGNAIATVYGDADGLAAKLDEAPIGPVLPVPVDDLRTQARTLLRQLCRVGG